MLSAGTSSLDPKSKRIFSLAPHRAVVTTSWDDDHSSSLQVAELLSAAKLPGTFYVPTGRLGEGSVLGATDLRSLSAAGFEVGAHTVSHRILTNLSAQEQAREITECKQTLQQILGREVTTFCYPRGRFDAAVVRQVKRAGYHGARGTRMLHCGREFDPFEIPTTVQAYPHRRSNYVRNLVRLRAFPALLTSIPDLVQFSGWERLGKKMFDRVLRNGGIWHLYGHPWEIGKLNLWSQLREMLDYVSDRAEVTYANNGRLLDLASAGHHAETEDVAQARHGMVL